MTKTDKATNPDKQSITTNPDKHSITTNPDIKEGNNHQPGH